jgi:predicted DNA-binding transcriptional regulator AlpA
MIDPDLLDAKAACKLIGGSRPINPATLWRGVKSGFYPKPIKVSPNANRWLRSELVTAIERRAAERYGAAVPSASGRKESDQP